MDFKSIEAKWQKFWDDNKVFCKQTKEYSNPFYVLTMFPYPSGDRLHMGHWYQYGLMDSWARWQMMRGKEVFQPMGFDAFGLPAENFAIKTGIHPKKSTQRNVDYMIEQFKKMGTAYNWDALINTSTPDYYKWTQWLFLKLYHAGLVEKHMAPVNWCDSCQTVLANEQVKNSCCDRCNNQIIQKKMSQWFFKITNYAAQLDSSIDDLDWPQATKDMQKHWIGKTEGFVFHGYTSHGHECRIFFSQEATLKNKEFILVSPETVIEKGLFSKEKEIAVIELCQQIINKPLLDRQSSKVPMYLDTGCFWFHPQYKDIRIPIIVSEHVLYEEIFEGLFSKTNQNTKEHYIDSVLNCSVALDPLLQSFEGDAKAIVFWRLKDWLVSRQRYWGAPIPMIYCESCGNVPVREKDLPVALPDHVDFKPKGYSPLSDVNDFVDCICPQCGKPAKRETDTLDTFVCSSWYFLRFLDNKNQSAIFDRDLVAKFMPVQQYVGGPEHACMHLLYARFIQRFLYDQGLVNCQEPFQKLVHQGLILGPDGNKMSKSKGNTVSPDEYVEKFGSDILRISLAFSFRYVEGGPWDEGGIVAMQRLRDRLERLFVKVEELGLSQGVPNKMFSEQDSQLLARAHFCMKEIEQDMERFMFNTSVARAMELYNAMHQYLNSSGVIKYTLVMQCSKYLLQFLAPFMPHFCEEWWQKFGGINSIFSEPWPAWDASMLEKDQIPVVIMVNGKVRAELILQKGLEEEEVFAEVLKQTKVMVSLGDKKIIKRIFVRDKLLNIVC